MRLSVQVRTKVGTTLERWQRSVYVEPKDRDRMVRFDEMTPVGATGSTHPSLTDVRSLMFVIDTTNTKPGSSGRVWLSSVRLEREER